MKMMRSAASYNLTEYSWPSFNYTRSGRIFERPPLICYLSPHWRGVIILPSCPAAKLLFLVLDSISVTAKKNDTEHSLRLLPSSQALLNLLSPLQACENILPDRYTPNYIRKSLCQCQPDSTTLMTGSRNFGFIQKASGSKGGRYAFSKLILHTPWAPLTE